MKDYLLRCISESGSIRAYVALTTNAVNEAYRRQKPASLSGVMLGRALTGAALLGGTVKQRERIAIKFEGNGPLRKLLAESDGMGHVRGYAGNCDVDFVEGDSLISQIKDSVGNAGLISVTKDLGLKEPYTGTVHMVSGEIGEDIAFYLTDSEQIPSAVSVGAIPAADGNSVEVAGGFLIQAIPQEGGVSAKDEANLEAITKIVSEAESITAMLGSGKRPEEVMEVLLAEVPFKVLDRVPLHFACSCSKKRIEQALKSVGADQIKELINEGHPVDINCEFCKEQYSFTTEELESLL